MTNDKDTSMTSLEELAIRLTEPGYVPTQEELDELTSNDELREACLYLQTVNQCTDSDDDKALMEREKAKFLNRINDEEASQNRNNESLHNSVETDGPAHPRMLSIVRWIAATAAVIAIAVGIFWHNPFGSSSVIEPTAETFASIDTAMHDVTIASADGSVEKVVEETHVTTQKGSFTLLDASKLVAEKITVTVPRGKTYKVLLTDGTEVYMYPDSRLLFPKDFSDKERDVILYGEAYFHVAKDPDHPFVVRTSSLETTVLGTEFHISDYNNASSATVTLINGSVRAGQLNSDVVYTLKPGQQLSSSAKGLSVANVDTDPYTMLIQGYFYFDNTALSQVMEYLGRWYGLDIEYHTKQGRNSPIRFIAEQDSGLTKVLQRLNSLEMVSVTQFGNKLIIEDK